MRRLIHWGQVDCNEEVNTLRRSKTIRDFSLKAKKFLLSMFSRWWWLGTGWYVWHPKDFDFKQILQYWNSLSAGWLHTQCVGMPRPLQIALFSQNNIKWRYHFRILAIILSVQTMTINMILGAFQSNTGSEMDASHCSIANLPSIKKYMYNYCPLYQNYIQGLHFCRNRCLLIFYVLLANWSIPFLSFFPSLSPCPLLST